MSARRGIEVHDGHVILPDMTTPLVIGTRHDPITQQAIMEGVVQGWVTSGAFGIDWDLLGGDFGVNVGADRTGDAIGVGGRVYVNDGVTMDGHVYGAHIRACALDGSILNNTLEGLHIVVSTGATTTLNVPDLYGILISNYCMVANANYHFIRLDENGAVNVQALISSFIGGTSTISYVFYFGAVENAWDWDGDKASGGTPLGWLRCYVAGYVRYVQLYRPNGEEAPA